MTKGEGEEDWIDTQKLQHNYLSGRYIGFPHEAAENNGFLETLNLEFLMTPRMFHDVDYDVALQNKQGKKQSER